MEKIEPHCIVKQTGTTVQYCSVALQKNGHTPWFDPQMKKLEPPCIVQQTVPQYSTVQ